VTPTLQADPDCARPATDSTPSEAPASQPHTAVAPGGSPAPLFPYYLPFWPRFLGAAAIALIGAWQGWRWTVVLAATLALPAFYYISPSLLVGVLPFFREAVARWSGGHLTPALTPS
jgi:hypothetical protein